MRDHIKTVPRYHSSGTLAVIWTVPIFAPRRIIRRNR
jgi:hypothetical protein